MKQKLVNMFKSRWRSNIVCNTGKLRTFSLFKNNCCMEPYFRILKDKELRTLFTKIRISAHKLRIETGRYQKVPADQRFCDICQLNLIEDEIHFSMSCRCFDDSRNNLFVKVHAVNKNFLSLTDEQKFIWLMSSEDHYIVLLFAKFLHDIYNKRSCLLKSVHDIQ